MMMRDTLWARYWRKRFGKSKDEIEAAIAKVGGNAETLIKELRVSDWRLSALLGRADEAIGSGGDDYL